MLATLKICVRCFVCWNIKAEAKGGLIRQRRAKVKAARRIKTTVRTQIPKVSLSIDIETYKDNNNYIKDKSSKDLYDVHKKKTCKSKLNILY